MSNLEQKARRQGAEDMGQKMILAEEQQFAIDRILSWHKSSCKSYFILQGYAGTGKTTMMKYLANLIGEEKVVFLAFTGKAALQLRSKGCKNAVTVHKALYDVLPTPKQEIEHLENILKIQYRPEIEEKIRSLKKPRFSFMPKMQLMASSLIIVDEYSMIGEKIFNDLIRTGKRILFVGDPAQLPPVKDTCPIAKEQPNAVLKQVQRQSLDNPILEAATNVRKGMFSLLKSNGNFQIKRKEDISIEELLKADQILCGLNKTRNEINEKIRSFKNFDDFPHFGEKIIFSRNDYEKGIFNGSIGFINEFYYEDEDENILSCTIDGQRFDNIEVLIGQNNDKFKQSIDYAYAITVHKSQGSEWDEVIIFDERVYGVDYKQWLYTAITRARHQCTLVRD